MNRSKTVGYTPARSGQGPRFVLVLATTAVVLGLLTAAFFAGRLTAPTGSAMDAVGDFPMRNGVPVPARHSVAGAATAAANFEIAGFRVSGGTLDAQAATVLLSDSATDSAKGVLQAPKATAADLSKGRTTFAPLSTVVQSYDGGNHAVVLVWGVNASSSQIMPTPAGTEGWGRSAVSLAWDGNSWRVTDQQFQTGPWPVRADQRFGQAEGDFTFRFNETKGGGWLYVPEG